MDLKKSYTEASQKTASNIRTIARSSELRKLSHLSLPKIDEIVDLVARVIPAGNVPGVILNGLARLSGKKLPPENVKRDINLLFKGAEQALDKAVYGAFFAGPAAVIWGYQNLLKLVGKDPEVAFPEGTWQFYTGYALREDSARHAYETYGFDGLLKNHDLKLDKVDRITAWTMTAIHHLHHYQRLLSNEWRERTYTHILAKITQKQSDAEHYAKLYRKWEKARPFKRDTDTNPEDDFPAYRRRKFEAFLKKETEDLSPFLRGRWRLQIRSAEKRDLPAYLKQMSILAYLNPGAYDETRVTLPLEKTHIGIIYRENYYLISACEAGSSDPADVKVVREQIATLLQDAEENPSPPHSLTLLAKTKRSMLPKLLSQINEETAQEIINLRLAPIFINFDQHGRDLPLSEIRQHERGIGDHAMTLFDTGKTMVFDLSHIFFDGAWGAGLSEIMTNEAIAWAVYLNGEKPAHAGKMRPYASSASRIQARDAEIIRQAPRLRRESSAENESVDLKSISKLRKNLRERNESIRLTVNDILILYRAIHGVTYKTDLLDEKPTNPAILIPIDASQRSPKERLYPMTFETPLEDLGLVALHSKVVDALDNYERTTGNRSTAYAKFDELQRNYLAILAGFGALMSRSKEIALAGESASVGTIKLLAHLPAPLQHILDKIPSKFNVLNDIIKGSEVFSNVGAVVPSSTLTRFITAKDDNDKKMLAWGVVTDAKGVMHISLRDFRPHVDEFAARGQMDLAKKITQDYLDAYARGLNVFVTDLRRITSRSRETKLKV